MVTTNKLLIQWWSYLISDKFSTIKDPFIMLFRSCFMTQQNQEMLGFHKQHWELNIQTFRNIFLSGLVSIPTILA